MSLDYEETLAATRRWAAETTLPELHMEKLAAELDAAQSRARRIQLTALLLALAVVTTWLTSIFGHPVVEPICAWVGAADVVRYGVVHVLGFVLAALLVTRDRTLHRVLVRALWWSTLLASTVGMWTQSGTLPLLMPVIALASACALLVLDVFDRGRPTDDIASDDFPLAAHRRSITLMMILAIADAETLLTAGLNHDEPGTLAYALLDYSCAIAMVAAIYGLYRVRTWGLLATVGLNLVIATLGFSGLLLYDLGFAYLLGVTAALQLALCAPLLRTLRSGEPPETRRRPSRGRPWSRVIIVALLVAGAVATVRSSDPEFISARCVEDE